MVDTSIIIDILRGYSPALFWIRQQSGILGVSAIVWLEVLEGAQNKVDQKLALDLLKLFYRVPLTYEDGELAIQQLLRVNLSHNVDAFDCLIGVTAFRMNVPLYTRNIKHFKTLLGEQAILPY